MRSRNPFSTQAKVRSTLAASDRPMRIPEIRDRIGLSGADGYARVNRAMTDLHKARQTERVGRGLWIYAGDKPDSAYCAAQRRMQRIMWKRSKCGEFFTARRIAELSESTLWFAQKYIAFLSDRGVLRKEGKIQVGKAAYAPLYIGDDAYLITDEWPVMRTKSGIREMDACLNEMRELAQRFFAVDNLDADNLLNLKDTVSRLGVLVDECENIKSNLRQTGKKEVGNGLSGQEEQ